MGRFVDPLPQYIDTDGSPLSGAQMFFFTTDTDTAEDTFADSSIDPLNLNSRPVICDAAGAPPDIFLDPAVIYRLQILRADGSLFSNKNNVLGLNDSGVAVQNGIPDWDTTVSYSLPDQVVGSDNNFYQAINAIAAAGNNPTLVTPTFWTQFTHLKLWNTEESYADNFIVQQDGILYKSRVGSNQGFSPDSFPDKWANSSGIGVQTIYIPARAMIPRISDGAPLLAVETGSKISLFTNNFSPSSVEFVQFEIEFPESWDLKIISIHIDWSTTSSIVGSVVWNLQEVSIADTETLDTAFSTPAIDLEGASAGANKLNKTSAISIEINQGGPGESAYFQISRNPLDVLDTITDADARLHGVLLLYTTLSSVD